MIKRGWGSECVGVLWSRKGKSGGGAAGSVCGVRFLVSRLEEGSRRLNRPLQVLSQHTAASTLPAHKHTRQTLPSAEEMHYLF